MYISPDRTVGGQSVGRFRLYEVPWAPLGRLLDPEMHIPPWYWISIATTVQRGVPEASSGVTGGRGSPAHCVAVFPPGIATVHRSAPEAGFVRWQLARARYRPSPDPLAGRIHLVGSLCQHRPSEELRRDAPLPGVDVLPAGHAAEVVLMESAVGSQLTQPGTQITVVLPGPAGTE